MIRHIILIKFKTTASINEIDKLKQNFESMPTKIEGVSSVEWGLNDSPENFHQDFTHCYLITFSSEEDRDNVYSPHPAHKAFVASLQPHLEKVFVVDYWAN